MRSMNATSVPCGPRDLKLVHLLVTEAAPHVGRVVRRKHDRLPWKEKLALNGSFLG